MNDQEFLKAFEDCTLEAFPHRSHIRMAWLYLRHEGWEGGMPAIRDGIQRFAQALGASSKYHETITRFWAYMVDDALANMPGESDFDGFIQANPHLLDTRFINQYYTHAHLFSEVARREWVEPDIKPLPEHAR